MGFSGPGLDLGQTKPRTAKNDETRPPGKPQAHHPANWSNPPDGQAVLFRWPGVEAEAREAGADVLRSAVASRSGAWRGGRGVRTPVRWPAHEVRRGGEMARNSRTPKDFN